MRCHVSRNGNEDVPALVTGVPLTKLPDARFEHLISVKSGILPQQRMCERRDQRLGRVTQDEMASDKAGCRVDLLLAIKGIEQSSADFLGGNRQIVEPIIAFARQRGRRHV